MWTLLMLTLCSSLQEGMRPSQCDALCENGRFVDSVNPCNTCENRKACSLATEGKPGCDCLPGYFRNAEEKCVLEEDCEGRLPYFEKGVLRRSRPADKINCRKDEVFLECSCEKTCCNGGQTKGCSASCSKGCFCKKGLVRHEDGRCIRLQECEKKSSPGSGTPPVQCSMPKCDVGCRIDYSTKPCPSCSCTDSPPIQCSPPKCGPGCSTDYSTEPCPSCSCPNLPSPTNCRPDEELYECMPLCTGTCSAYSTQSYLFCKMACRSGCFCRKGLYKTEDGRCVPASQCTAPNSPPENDCGANAEYKTCGSACPPTCANRDKKLLCTQQCVSGCFCKKGFVKNERGMCVQPAECQQSPPMIQCSPPKCGPGCSMDYSTEPCPSCSCPNSPPVQCSIPNCDVGCRIDYSTKPCPSCSCAGPPEIQCGIPNCDEGCSIDYSTKPCPSCSCSDTCGEDEEYKECGSACPPTCSNRGKNEICTQQCVPGCFCADGLVRNEEGECVEPEECPENPPKIRCTPPRCGPGCTLDRSTKPCPSCSCPSRGPGDRCGRNKQSYECIPRCSRTCEAYTRRPKVYCRPLCRSGCFCREGLYERADGQCVPPTQCPAVPPKKKCPRNEVFSKCANPCNDCETRGKCNFLVCNEGCDCKKGYHRNSNGRCIPAKQCPVVNPTPPSNVCESDKQYYECIPSCQRTCNAYRRKEKILCNQLCVSGCFCRDGLYLADDGVTCVKPEQCNSAPPTKKCPRNEVLSKCANPCNDCQTRGKCNFLVCNEGCDCKKGYHRNSNGRCIPAKKCPVNNPTPAPTECASNEQYYECIPRCMRTCKAYSRPVKLYCSQLCISGCFCKEGLYEADDGTCVPPEQCSAPTTSPGVTPSPSQCGADEQFYDCIPGCQQTCFALTSEVKIACKMPCRSGCYCREGLYKKDDGSCVPPEGCFDSTVPTTVPSAPTPTLSCGKNEEYYSCIPTCKNTCENYQALKPLCPRICIKGCFCKKGLVKRSDGKCVKPEKCIKSSPTIKPTKPMNQKCNPNEQFYNCIPTCKNTCENYQAKRPICPLICIKGCFCKKGLVKRSDGKCVRPDKCESSSPTPTPTLPTSNPTCMLDKEIGPCRQSLTRYFYNYRTGQCEKFKYGGCLGNKNNFKTKEDCQVICEGTPTTKVQCSIPLCRTDCTIDYSTKPCPSCSCPTVPPPTNSVCMQPKQVGLCKALIPRFFYNQQTGQCEKFYYGGCGGNKNNFEKKEDCEMTCGKSSTPSPSKCGKDEQYYSCVPNCHNTCDTYQQKGPCPLYCMSGCFCKQGMVKNKNGKCVQPSQCPSTNPPPSENSGECGANEEYYDDCAPKCTGTCEAYNNPGIYHCPRCFPGCWCSQGFVKRRDGQCVPPDQCNVPTTTTPSPTSICQQPKVVGPCRARVPRYFYNRQTGQCEQFDYGGCRGNQNNFKTKEECEASCGSGPPEQCGEDEEYYKDCAPSCGGTCETYPKLPILNCRLCRPGCWCSKGLVKRKDGKCVPKDQCGITPTDVPPNTCSEDEEYLSCGSACPPSCSTLGKSDFSCIALCVPGCFCKQGLIRNARGECVEPEDCPQNTCGEDEEYKECGSACPPTCSNLGKNQICTQQCVPGCFCSEGLVRNEDGECVEPEECPQPTCNEDEEYKECGSSCPRSCSNLGKNIICTKDCVPGCFCREGLVRNDRGECVEPEECPQGGTTPPVPTDTCGANEEYKNCGTACPATCSNVGMDRICTLECVPGCFCKEGFVRNDQGQCVEPEDCPQKTCGEDEEYNDCGSACPPSCSNFGKNQVCTDQCVQGCFCREGLVRNDKGECVEPEECPQKSPRECGEDEKYYDCTPSCGGTCDTYNMTAVILCLPCGPGCWCNKGLVKNGEGKCVLPEQCDVPKGPNKLCGVNEIYYDKCAPSCRGTCLTHNQDVLCPECTPGCWCKKGYLKNLYGKCVPKNKCNIKRKIPTCPKDQQYYDCIPSCKRTCMTYNSTSAYCPKECIKGCFCKEGLIMNKEGRCVPPTECPLTCPLSQKYYECMPDCQNRCNPPDACAAVCKSGCFCKEGLVMREDGKCVREELCKAKNNGKPQCGPDQEYYDCFQRCRNSCATGNGVCPTVCESGCFCKKGLMLNRGGKCVKPDECEDEGNNGNPGSKPGNKPGSGETCSGVNEEVVSCAKPKTCNTCLIRGDCKLKRCESGCDCKSGYYRDDSGTCIPQDQCPGATPQCSGKNEEIVPCAKPKWCNTCGIRGNCKLTECQSGCDCKSGYYRDGSGVCIPQDQCPASNAPGDSNTGPGNTIVPGSENDSSFESSYFEESFSSISETQSFESDSTSQSSNIQKKSSGSGSWFSDSESGNEVDFEANSSEELEADYSSITTIATEWSSDMSSDSEQSSSGSSSGSGMWSSSSSSRSKRESGENEIDSFDELSIFEDKSSSNFESGYSSISSGSESWSTDMSSDSEQSSSKSSSGSGMWSSSSSSRSKRESGENEIGSFDESEIFEDKSSSDMESGYSDMSSGSESWSTNMSSDSEQNSSKSSSESGMWSSSSSSISERESAGNEIGSSDELTIFEDESSSYMESGYSTMSSDSESWSVDMSGDSEMSSSKSSSGSRMWSSKMSSEFESDEEKQEKNDEAIYASDGNGYEEYFYSWTEVEGDDEN